MDLLRTIIFCVAAILILAVGFPLFYILGPRIKRIWSLKEVVLFKQGVRLVSVGLYAQITGVIIMMFCLFFYS